MRNWGPKVERKSITQIPIASLHPLESWLLAATSSKELTQTSKRRLHEPARFINSDGEIVVMPDPCSLWDQQQDFQEYCRTEVLKVLFTFQKRVNQTNLVAHICGYHWKNIGYLAWKEKHAPQKEAGATEVRIEIE